jgi:uncharacterized membrane protein YkoI
MALELKSALKAIVIAAATLLASPSAHADGRDHDAARKAVEAGEIRPLAEIMEGLRGQLPGEVVGVKLEKEKGLWVYELRTLDGRGRLFEVYVDGRSGAIVRTKEK